MSFVGGIIEAGIHSGTEAATHEAAELAVRQAEHVAGETALKSGLILGEDGAKVVLNAEHSAAELASLTGKSTAVAESAVKQAGKAGMVTMAKKLGLIAGVGVVAYFMIKNKEGPMSALGSALKTMFPSAWMLLKVLVGVFIAYVAYKIYRTVTYFTGGIGPEENMGNRINYTPMQTPRQRNLNFQPNYAYPRA